jgi:phosphoglycolate phosphatase
MTGMNTMLKKRGLPMLESIDAYHSVFGFPIKEYYRRVGFDFETEAFETLAAEYIELYHSNDNSVELYSGTKKVLTEFQYRGIHQIILSASEHKNLMSQIKPFGIEHCFDEILGISDIFGVSKINVGKEYIRRVMPKRAVLIGDTLHDKEVADALGVDCILVANGHQSKAILLSCDGLVIDQLTDVVKYIE